MLRAAGIRMSPTRLLEENGRAHFMTRRFDRTPDGERVHLQSLCATDGLDFNAIGQNDYAQYLQRVAALAPESLREAFARMVFNVAAANHDDHTKNVAFLMDASGRWSLAPAYDVTHASSPTSVWLGRHLMSVNGRFDDIRRDDLVTVAERFGVPRHAAIFAEVNDALSSWPEFAAEAGLDTGLADQVARDFRPVGRRRGSRPATS